MGLQEKLQKEKSNLVQEKSQTQKINLEFTLFAEWINVIQNKLLRYLKHYKIDDALNSIVTSSNTSSPKELVESLAEYIQNIIRDIEEKTFSIKKKRKIMTVHYDDTGNGDENEQNNQNGFSKFHKNKTKKTRKTKR